MQQPEELKLKDIKTAAEVIKNGGVVIFPTDTVYGIGCAYNNKEAKAKIYKIKNTPDSQNFPVLVSNAEQVKKIANINSLAAKLIKKYWPGQLTIILKTKSGQNIGFRQPDSQIIRSIIEKAKIPVVGTSANFHGKKTPTSFDDLDPNFAKKADLVINGECDKKIESTVVDLTSKPPKILRQGAVKINDFKN